MVNSHRDLVRQRKAMIEALSQRPDLLPLLLANPVLAFRDAGVTMSAEVANHVLHSVRHAPAVRVEREQLTAQLREALGVVPHPSDPEWLAQTLFTRLKVRPLVTRGMEPAYVPAIPDDARERLEALLPKRHRRELAPLPDQVSRPQALRRLDLDAPLVECKPARAGPKRLSLEQLWFYRGSHELVRPLLRLGIIERNALPILSASAYRDLKAGRRENDLVRWISGVSWPAEKRRRRPT